LRHITFLGPGAGSLGKAMGSIEEKVLKLRSEGKSIREIARELGISKDKVHRILKRFKESKSTQEIQHYRQYIKNLLNDSLVKLSTLLNHFDELVKSRGPINEAINVLLDIKKILNSIEFELRILATTLSINDTMRKAIQHFVKYSENIRDSIELTLILAPARGNAYNLYQILLLSLRSKRLDSEVLNEFRTLLGLFTQLLL